MTPHHKVIDFDHHSPEYAADGLNALRELREECPVAFSERWGGMWVVADYEHVARVVKDDATFSSYYQAGTPFQGIVIPNGDKPIATIPIEYDPPKFFPYRRMLNPWFSPAAISRLEPKLRQVVDAVIDEVIETGRIDFVEHVANPVPAIMTLHLLGLPVEDWAFYSLPAHETSSSGPSTLERETALVEMDSVNARLEEAIRVRRAAPRDDLISFLTQVEIDGAPLPEDEVPSIVGLVLAGGIDTTSALIGNALLYLGQDCVARQRLIDDPSLRRLACEEFLRWVSPIQTQARTVTGETELGGCRMSRGERVLVSWAGANRDQKVFDRPDEVILDRFPNRHLAFSVGIHRCIGSNLARSQFLAVLDAILTRMPDYKLDADGATRYPSVGMINGLIALPATFAPGARVGATIV